MKTLYRIVLSAFFATFFTEPPEAGAQSFVTTTIDTGRPSVDARFTSMAIVDGKPAVVYRDNLTSNTRFARNAAADGSGAWTVSTISGISGASDFSLAIIDGKPALSMYFGSQLIFARNSAIDGSGVWSFTVVESGLSGHTNVFTSLASIDGRPAIAYYSGNRGDLRFAINSAIDGTGAWTLSTVDSGNGVETTVYVGTHASLKEVNGQPAISYYDNTNGDLKFARNSAADGSGMWAITTVASSGTVGTDTSLAIVDGRPAISFISNSSTLSFAINSLADGTGSWTLTTVQAGSVVSFYGTSLAVVGGVPAIGYFSFSGPRFARNSAADASGTWSIINPLPASDTTSIGYYPVLLEVSSTPAMICTDYVTSDLRFMRAPAADGSGAWATNYVENTGTIGQFSSAAVIAGNPAVAYYDAAFERLKFARNSAADGSGTWALSVVDAAANVGPSPSLRIVDGRPAISYFDVTNADLKYAINSAADGTGAWTVSTVASTGFVGTFTSMAVVNGKPAISYYDDTNDDLKYAINSAADGSGTWTVVTVDSTGFVGRSTSLAVVDGNPAISYVADSAADLKFARASTVDGTGSWTSVIVDSGSIFDDTSLAVVDGKPAIAYREDSNFDLKFAINSAVDGSGTWSLAVVNVNGGSDAALAVINGKPSIAYPFGALAYARNSSIDGTGVWATMTNDPGAAGAGASPSLIELATGGPGISSYNSGSPGSLRWSRFSASTAPEIDFEQPIGNAIFNGSSINFGSFVLGSTKTLTFLVKNLGLGTLTVDPPTLLGTHPGDFSVNAASVPASLDRVQAATFTVTFNPTAAGTRSAILRITNSDSNEATTNFTVTGTAFSFANDTDGDGLNDATEFNLSALGFNPTLSQPSLVQSYFSAANGAGLFTTSQVQALHVGTPLLQRDAATGTFTLTLALKKATNLAAPNSFVPFPFTDPGTAINGQGQLQFQFTVPDNAALFRLETP